MPRSTTVYRIFVSSPGDLKRERNAMQGIVNEANRILEALSPEEAVQVSLLRWESDVAPQIAAGPQPIVNEQIESYDIFLGLLSKRFGTPTADARSGTEEEFRIAHERFRKHGAPWVAFFFNSKVEPPQGDEELAQYERVKAFKAELRTIGITDDYHGAESFMSAVLTPLLQIVGKLIVKERRARSVLPLAAARFDGSIAEQPVPIGKRFRIADIGERDACYFERGKYIGKPGVVLEAQKFGEWLRGTFQFDKPFDTDDDGRYIFLQFRVAEADSPENDRSPSA